MKKYILRIDSLIKTFSIIETGKDIAFNYESKEGTEAFNDVNVGDIIKAKAIEEDGTETEVASYTVKAISDAIGAKSFDNNQQTTLKLETFSK